MARRTSRLLGVRHICCARARTRSVTTPPFRRPVLAAGNAIKRTVRGAFSPRAIVRLMQLARARHRAVSTGVCAYSGFSELVPPGESPSGYCFLNKNPSKILRFLAAGHASTKNVFTLYGAKTEWIAVVPLASQSGPSAGEPGVREKDNNFQSIPRVSRDGAGPGRVRSGRVRPVRLKIITS